MLSINVIVRILNNCEPAHKIEEPLAVVVTAERQQYQRHCETQQTSSGVCNAPTGSATTLDAKMSHRRRGRHGRTQSRPQDTPSML